MIGCFKPPSFQVGDDDVPCTEHCSILSSVILPTTSGLHLPNRPMVPFFRHGWRSCLSCC